MPEVSVIIPNYNHAPFLKQRIDSVLSQTYQDFEVIILDDSSTDNSRDILEGYRTHPKVSSITYNDRNTGNTFSQWEKGILMAQGNYIWIAESDDWCEPTFLENIVPPLVENPGCVIGYCQAYCVVGNDIKAQSSHPFLQEYINGLTFIKEYLVTTNSIYNASMAVWKKSAFAKISKDFLQYRFVGDWLFWVELSTTGDVYVTGRILNYFRKHDKDVSGKAYSTGKNYIEEIKLLKAMLAKKLIEPGMYDKLVATKFYYYKRREKSIAPEQRKLILESFTREVSKAYLQKHYWVQSAKFRGYNFLNVLLKKYR